jgi:uncharacterized protein (TIGR00645 family)
MNTPKTPAAHAPLPALIFASRWLQLPLYLGLILAQAVYVFHFWVELVHLIEAAFGNTQALDTLVKSVGYLPPADGQVKLNETLIMLVVLGLIDVVMISNLLIMVIVGGYETFVSRMNLEGHPDQPEWLDHVNASVLKVKLATAIIGISSIHLLKSFISAANIDQKTLLWQTLIHLTFLLSALAIAATDRLLGHGHPPRRRPLSSAGRRASSSAPSTPDSTEPHSTPSLTGVSWSPGRPTKARPPMNRLIVKPMPHSTLTPKTCPQLAPAGALAQPSRTIAHTQPKTPSVLPTSRPAVMPSDTGCSRSDQLRPASDTPALAKANIGSTRKATQGAGRAPAPRPANGRPRHRWG